MEFEIFKTGTHTSDNGQTKTYSEDDLNFIAQSYQPDIHEAPIVIGHPENNMPAYGWIESLKVVGDKLVAKAKDVIPEFKEALQKKLYKKRSISLDENGKLRHVGFLGAAPPAVKGLADIKFSETPGASYEFQLEKVTPLDNSALEPPNFNEQIKKLNDTITNFVNSSQNNHVLNSDFQNIASEVNDLKFKIESSEFEQKLNQKIQNGNLTPAMKTHSMNFLKFINTQNFSQGFNFTQFKAKLNSLLNEFIDSIPKIIYYENFAQNPDNPPQYQTENYSGLPVDPESETLHKKALSLMQKDDLSYEAALMKITRKEI